MRLNGASFNTRPLNSSFRSVVLATSRAVLENRAALVGVKHSNGSGQATLLLKGEFPGSTQRFAQGRLDLLLEGELAQTVSRSGTGCAMLEVDADLFYTRVVYGFGSTAIDLDMRGDVGVVFIEGEARLELPDTEWEGAKLRRASATGVTLLSGDLNASALRRPKGNCSLAILSGALEPSHVDAAGHRHIGGFGEARSQFNIEDGGMLRQSRLGKAALSLGAEASGRIERTTLAGAATTQLNLIADFQIQRRGEGKSAVILGGDCAGEVMVPGEGQAIVSFSGKGTAYKITRVSLEGQPVVLDSELKGVRTHVSPGEAVVALAGQLTGTRARVLDGEGIMVLLTPSSAYVNLTAEDDDEQNFIRPGIPRAFLRPAQIKEWNRV